MASVTGTLSTAGSTVGILYIPRGESFTVTIDGTWTGVVALDEVIGGGITANALKTYTATASETLVNDYGRDLMLRLRVVTREASETVTGTLADYDAAVNESVSGTLAVTGAATFSSTAQIAGVTASNVTKIVLDGSGNALIARCATANIPSGAGYAKGCILIATDGTNHTNTLYANIGDATTANFNAVTIAADV